MIDTCLLKMVYMPEPVKSLLNFPCFDASLRVDDLRAQILAVVEETLRPKGGLSINVKEITGI